MSDRAYDHMMMVDVGDGAHVIVPNGELEWKLRYGNPEEVRFAAASVVGSFDYLVMHCTQKEQIRRLRLMKAAKTYSSPMDSSNKPVIKIPSYYTVVSEA